MNALEIPPLVVHSRPALRLPALTTSDDVTRLYIDETTQDIVAFTGDGCVAFFTSCNAAVTHTTEDRRRGIAQPLLYFRPTPEHEDSSRMNNNAIVDSTYPGIARRHPTPLLYTQDSTDRSIPPVHYLVALSNESSNSVDFYHVPACNSTAYYSSSSAAAFTGAESEESTVHVGCLVVHCVGRYRCTPPGLRFCTNEYYPIHTFHWCLPDTTSVQLTPSTLEENSEGCYDTTTHVLMCVSAVSIDVLSVHLVEDEHTTHSVNNTSLLSLPHAQLTMLQQYITHTDGWCYEPHTATLLSLNVRKSHILKPFRITPSYAHSGTKGKAKDVIQPLRKLVLDKSEGEALCRAYRSQRGSPQTHCASMGVTCIADTLGFILLYKELHLYHMMSAGTHILLYRCESKAPLSKDKSSSSSTVGFIPAVLLVWGTGIEPFQPRCLQVVDHILLVHHLADRVTTVYDTAMASEDNINSTQVESSETSHNTSSYTQHVTHRTVSSLSSSFTATTPHTVFASRGWLTALLPDTTSAPSIQEVSSNGMSSYAMTKTSTVAASCTHRSPHLTPLLIAPLCLYPSENTNTTIEGHAVTSDFAVYDDCLFSNSTGEVGSALVIHPVHRAVYHVGINPFVLVAGSILARHTGAPLARFFLRRFYHAGNTLPRLLRVVLHEAYIHSESVVRTTAWCQFVQVMDVCLTAYESLNTANAATCTLSDISRLNADFSAQVRLSVSADVLHNKSLWQVMCATPQGCLSVVQLCHYVFRYVYDELCALTHDSEKEEVCTADVQQAWYVLWRAVKYFARQVTLQVDANALQPFTDVLQEMTTDVVFAAAAANSECTTISLVATVRWLVTELRELLHSLPWYRPQMSLVHRLLTFIEAHNIKCYAPVMSLATQLLSYVLQQSSLLDTKRDINTVEEDDDDVLDLWLRYASCEDVHELMRELQESGATQVMQRLLQRAHIASENDSDAMRVYKCLLPYCGEG